MNKLARPLALVKKLVSATNNLVAKQLNPEASEHPRAITNPGPGNFTRGSAGATDLTSENTTDPRNPVGP